MVVEHSYCDSIVEARGGRHNLEAESERWNEISGEGEGVGATTNATLVFIPRISSWTCTCKGGFSRKEQDRVTRHQSARDVASILKETEKRPTPPRNTARRRRTA